MFVCYLCVPVEDIPQGDASRRFAVMGCDWDHVSAGDLLVLQRFRSGWVSFTPLLVDDYPLVMTNIAMENHHL